MPSSPAQPGLVPHPVVTAAASVAQDCTITAYFRTFNPGDGTFPPLANAPVKLVCGDPGKTVAGTTDATGKLCGTGPPGTDFIVPHIEALSAETFHFEVDLSGLSYPDGAGSTPFPVTKWETKGWQEPDGHWGQFSLTGPLFPVDPSAPPCWFTVGCYVNLPMKFLNEKRELVPYPENIILRLVLPTPPERPLRIRSGGILSEILFGIALGVELKVRGYFSAEAIPTDDISAVTGTFKTGALLATFTKAPGEKFGLNLIQKASSIRLFDKQEFSKDTLPQLTPKLTNPRIQFAAYQANAVNKYMDMTESDKIAIFFNWFIEFISYRNLFSRTMNNLMSQTSLIPWTGLLPLTLKIDDLITGVPSTSGQTIFASLDYILKPRADLAFHEMGHAFLNQYLSSGDASIYFPFVTGGHRFTSYSNEFFAFQEGFPQFIASLFMPPGQTYLLPNTVWPNLFEFQGSPYDARLGNSEDLILRPQLGPGAGLAMEVAFAASLTRAWENIWNARTTHTPGNQPWVEDLVGDGTLGLDSSTGPNCWLLDLDVQTKFATLIEAVALSGKVEGKISTRRIIDTIEKKTTGNQAWPWGALSPLFDHFRVINEFFVSSIKATTGNACIVSRSSHADFKYGTYRATQFLADLHHVIVKQAGDTLTLRGIRIPAGLIVSLEAGTDVVAAQVTWISEYEATAAFSQAALSAAPQGFYDLKLVAGAANQHVINAVEVKP